MDKKAMYKLSYGLFVLTAKEDSKDNGCIINTAIQAASEPNQLSICVNKLNYTHDMIQRTGAFTVSVISQNAAFDLFKQFGFQTGREADKFADFSSCTRGVNGIYYITEGTNAYISVKVTKSEGIQNAVSKLQSESSLKTGRSALLECMSNLVANGFTVKKIFLPSGKTPSVQSESIYTSAFSISLANRK